MNVWRWLGDAAQHLDDSIRKASADIKNHPDDIEVGLLRASNRKYIQQMLFMTLFWWTSSMLAPSEAFAEVATQGYVTSVIIVGIGLYAEGCERTELKFWVGQMERIIIVICLMFSMKSMTVTDPWGSTMLRGFSFVIIPVSRAKQTTSYVDYLTYGILNCLVCIVGFWHDLSGEGWQWCILSGLTMLCCSFGIQQRLEVKDAADTVNMTYGAMQRLLSMMSDGVLLLDQQGCIVGADAKASHLLGRDVREPWAETQFQSVFRSSMDSRELQRQLQSPAALLNLSLDAPSGDCLELEAYNVSCVVKASCTALLLGHGHGQEAKSSAFFCALRVKQLAADDQSASNMTKPRMGSFPRTEGRPHHSHDDDARSDFDLDDDADGADLHEVVNSVVDKVAHELNIDAHMLEHLGMHNLGDDCADLCKSADLFSVLSTGFGIFTGKDAMEDNFDAMSVGTGTIVENSVLGDEDCRRPTFGNSPLKVVPAVRLGDGGEYTVVKRVFHSDSTTLVKVAAADGGMYAMKRIKIPGRLWQQDFPRNLKNVDREVRSLKSLAWASSVIVTLVDSWLEADFNFACIVMEFLPYTLDGIFMERVKKQLGPLSIETTERYTAQLVAGLAVIHSSKLMHRDLKPSNVLVTGDRKNVKIADLGVSRQFRLPRYLNDRFDVRSYRSMDLASVIEDNDFECCDSISVCSGYTQNVGTKAYASPESLRSGSYDESTDIFSLGCVLFEMLSLENVKMLRKDAETESSAEGSLQAVVAQRLEDLKVRPVHLRSEQGDEPEGVEEAVLESWDPTACATRAGLCDICLDMLQPNPSERPSAQESAAFAVLQGGLNELLKEHPELQRAVGSSQ